LSAPRISITGCGAHPDEKVKGLLGDCAFWREETHAAHAAENASQSARVD